MTGKTPRWFQAAISAVAVAIACQTGSAAASANEEQEHSPGGAVFTLTNDAQANAVIAFNRSGRGTLSHPRSFATGGRGTGAGLGSQGAIALSRNGRWLFAVNAGSNDVSVFSVRGTELRLAHDPPPVERCRLASPTIATWSLFSTPVAPETSQGSFSPAPARSGLFQMESGP
jgi:hypothetical protein